MPKAEQQVHTATIALTEPAPSEVPVGATFAVKLVVTCAEGCDLHERALVVIGPAGAGEARQATPQDPAADHDCEIACQAPRQVGDHSWRIALAQDETGNVRHHAEPLSIGVSVKPQSTSLAVWDIPSPVVVGRAFKFKAGAKSAGDFALTGRAIEVCDETGAVIAQGALGDAPWPGTSGLYWTELELAGPGGEGTCHWSVRFAAADVDVPHDGAASNFTVAVRRPPEHRVTVKVAEKDTATPLEEAEVRLGVYRAITDGAGLAAIEVPKGTYDLVVWKAGYDVPILSTEVTADHTVELAATVAPEEDPDAIWQG